MAIPLKQSTASQEIPLGIFVDSTDGVTAETALTIANTDIKLWKAGATTLANKNSGGATHISGGIYYTVLDATDTNTLGSLIIFVQVAGALPVRVECVVYPANVYDSLIAGTDTLQADVTQISGSNVATGTAQLGVNVVSMVANTVSASAVAADAVTEIQSGLATAAALATVDSVVDSVALSIAGLNDLSAAEVNAEVLDVLTVDTFAEPASVPAATASLKDKINWLFALARNKVTQTSTTQTLRNDADDASIATSTVSDDGTTFTRGEWS